MLFKDIGGMRILHALVFGFFSLVVNAVDIPVEHFAKHGDFLDVKISPDGEHIAARLRQDGTVAVVFMRLSDGKMVGGLRASEGEIVHSVRWANNERVLYEYAEKGWWQDAPSSTGELFAVNIDNSRREMLFGYRASDKKLQSRIHSKESNYASHDVLNILPDDDKHILIIEYPWQLVGKFYRDNRVIHPIVSKLNIYTGKKRKVETLPFRDVIALADDNGLVRFVYYEDNDFNSYSAYRNTKKDEWTILETDLVSASAPSPISINTETNEVYLFGRSGDQQVRSLLGLDLKTGSVRTILQSERYDLGNTINDFDTDEPIIGVSWPVQAEYDYIKPQHPLAKLHKSLVKAYKGQDVYIADQTRDGSKLVLRVESDINPGEYYLFDRDSKQASFFWANLSWIDPNSLRPMKAISFAARDGLQIEGFLTMPEIAQDKKAPLVVLPHGGPFGIRDYWEYDDQVQLLANKGYAVLQVNFRGSGGYGMEFRKAGYKKWGTALINDIVDATRWAFKNESIDADRTCIFGTSYGGYAALMTVAREPDLFKCAVGYAGVYDLKLLYTESDVPILWGGKAYLRKAVGEDEALLTDQSPINHADKIKANVMLVHGDRDVRAPFENAVRMRKSLKKAGNEPAWMPLKQNGHGVWDEAKRVKYYQAVLDFLDQNIGIR